jgi:hypothetical protein
VEASPVGNLCGMRNPLWKLPLWNPLWKLRDQAPRDETDGVRNATLLRLFRQRRARTALSDESRLERRQHVSSRHHVIMF